MFFRDGDIVICNTTDSLGVIICNLEECVSHSSNFECMLNDYKCNYKDSDYFVVKTESGSQITIHKSDFTRVNLYEIV